eukprot:Skav202660  [mRNA]  locus=scaffold1791:178401:204621:+ [translate_table: standard]
MAVAPAWKKPRSAGPVVWWVRNDLRLQEGRRGGDGCGEMDNPVARAAVSEALTDQRPLLPLFIFDPRFLDRGSFYGRVTDPKFQKSISTRKPVDFSGRKTCALRCLFWLRCVRQLSDAVAQKGGRMLVCHGKPEEVLAKLPMGSLVLPRSVQEPVSPEQTDVEDQAALKMLGYSAEEIEEALSQPLPEAGEAAAQRCLEAWLQKQNEEPKEPSADPDGPVVLWDLPTGGAAGGHDALQWANLAKPDGWLRVPWRWWLPSGLPLGGSQPGDLRTRRRVAELQRRGAPPAVARAAPLECHQARRGAWWVGPGEAGSPEDWRIGAFHFEDVLLDYDVAMNYGNWVVVSEVDKSSRGAHGFKSVEDLAAWKMEEFEWKLTAEKSLGQWKNDPSGSYLRRWLPELQKLDAKYIHEPWAMTEELMTRCCSAAASQLGHHTVRGCWVRLAGCRLVACFGCWLLVVDGKPPL